MARASCISGVSPLLLATFFYPVLACATDDLPDMAELPVIEVAGVTPVKGLAQPRGEIASHVQSISNHMLHDHHSATALPDLMNSQLTGVSVNETQGNPFQAEVNYRGFTASPLLGAPQGLSIYQDGVRINEPFGDTVNWDLIPRLAVSALDLIPGSNPLFGLNTLG
ncbi:MAG: Plug domain-containing protein, partial [Rugosibacter sp.]